MTHNLERDSRNSPRNDKDYGISKQEHQPLNIYSVFKENSQYLRKKFKRAKEPHRISRDEKYIIRNVKIYHMALTSDWKM